MGQACATLVGKSLGEKKPGKAFSCIYETIRLSGIDWAFCGSGTNAIGGFSKFKVHTTTPDPWDIIHGARK